MKCAKKSCPFTATYGNHCSQHRGEKRGGSVEIGKSGYNFIIIDESTGIRGRRISDVQFKRLSAKINSIKSTDYNGAKNSFKVVIIENGREENHYQLVEELSTNKVIFINKKRLLKRNAG